MSMNATHPLGLLALFAAAAAAATTLPALRLGNKTLTISPSGALTLSDGSHAVLYAATPAQVALVVGEGPEKLVAEAYAATTQLSAGALEANVTLRHGAAELRVTDCWTIAGTGGLRDARFELKREIAVVNNPPASGVRGLQSRLMFELSLAPAGTTVADLTCFAPALWCVLALPSLDEALLDAAGHAVHAPCRRCCFPQVRQ